MADSALSQLVSATTLRTSDSIYGVQAGTDVRIAAGLISQIVSAGGNNITLSQSSNTITISGPNTSAQSNQTDGIYLSQNTTGNSSSLTYDARSLSVEGLGIVSVGWSTNNSHLLISASSLQSNQTN